MMMQRNSNEARVKYIYLRSKIGSSGDSSDGVAVAKVASKRRLTKLRMVILNGEACNQYQEESMRETQTLVTLTTRGPERNKTRDVCREKLETSSTVPGI